MDCTDREFWVFGYGSLCWNPGFEFKDSMVGYVEGFSRKFWQGNIAHRGTKEKVRKTISSILESIKQAPIYIYYLLFRIYLCLCVRCIHAVISGVITTSICTLLLWFGRRRVVVVSHVSRTARVADAMF